jgi:hypothetical protein
VIRWEEGTLIPSGTFSQPGKKEPLASDGEYEMIVASAIETPLERSKRGAGADIRGRESKARSKRG